MILTTKYIFDILIGIMCKKRFEVYDCRWQETAFFGELYFAFGTERFLIKLHCLLHQATTK